MKQMLSLQIPQMKRKSDRRSPKPCVQLNISHVVHILTRQHLDQLLLKLFFILSMVISISARTQRSFESAAGVVSRPSTTRAMHVNNLVIGGRTVHFSNAISSTLHVAIHNRAISNENLVNDKYLSLFSDFWFWLLFIWRYWDFALTSEIFFYSVLGAYWCKFH